MDIVTAATKSKPETFVNEKPLPIDKLSPKQKAYIKWLASIPADGLPVKNGTIKPLPDRIANIKKAIAKHIKTFNKAKSPYEKWGQVFAIKGLRRGLWLHLQALEMQSKKRK
jgi:hypothetical protein